MSTAVIENTYTISDKDLKWFDELSSTNGQNGMPYFFVMDVPTTITHFITNEVTHIEKLMFAYEGGNFYLIENPNWSSDKRLFHSNISNSSSQFYVNGSRVLGYIRRHFCNSLNNSPRSVLENLDYVKATLAFNLTHQNPSNAYVQPTSNLCNVGKDYPIKRGNVFVSKDAELWELVTSGFEDLISQRISTLSILEDIDSYCYVKFRNNSEYILRPKSNCETCNKEFFSCYYPVLEAKDVYENLRNHKITYDCMMIGCGSAGSNIAHQLGKTNLISSYMFVDNDIIEYKNLKNTTFRTSDVRYYKADILRSTTSSLLENSSENKIASANTAFRPDSMCIYKGKYLFSLVDKLMARKDIFDNSYNYEYLIDTRFKDLSCSIYIVDLNNEDEVNYYKSGLDEAINLYIKEYKVPYDKIERLNFLNGIRYAINKDNMSYSYFDKLSDKTKDKLFENIDLKYKENMLQRMEASRQTCSSPNIIDIYTITAGVVVSSIRSIEDKKGKPFTHLELDTSTGIPLTMVVKK